MVVRQSLTTETPRQDCRERLSDAFIERMYESRERCVEIQQDDDGEPVDSVRFSRLRVRRDRATVGIELRGGDSGGARGDLGLVREGGRWRIDDLSVPLLRSLLNAGLAASERDGELPSGGRECVVAATQRLGGTELKELAYGGGDPEEATRSLLDLLAGCDGADGVSLLREYFEQALSEMLDEREVSAAMARCIILDVRDRLPDSEVAELLAEEDAQALQAAGAAAARACARGSRSAS